MCMMPYGIQDFKDIRKKGYIYIDKTKYIETLEKTGRKTVHFLRPRRFGKTLFTSMLNAYYDIDATEEFESLFKGTYIHTHPTEERNSYYMLRFDFSGLNTDETDFLKDRFHSCIYHTCVDFLENYHVDVDFPKGIDAADTMSYFIGKMRNRLHSPIYIIIDEYDQFANELLSFHFEDFHNVVSKNGYVRKFYEVLKSGTTDSTIGKIFITGVSPITLDSITSGFNISTNISLDPRFNEMMGFTSDEVNYLISMVEGIKDSVATLSEMKQIYDGYKFSIDGKHHVFNPNMVLYYLDYIQSFHKPPRNIIDPNIYSDYNKIENLLNIKSDKSQKIVLEEIMKDESITSHLTTAYELSKQFKREDFISLLYYLGYLTITGNCLDDVIFKVPNEVIKNVYFDYFNSMLNSECLVSTSNYGDIYKQILFEKKNDLLVRKVEELLHVLDHRDYIKFDEKYMKLLIVSIINGSNFIRMKSEFAVSEGFIDLILYPYQIEGTTALIELKYIKSKDYKEQYVQEKRDEAYAQLQRYQKADEFQNKDIVKWILIFSKNQCVWNETIL